jgi:hypothetical protein
MFVQPALPSVTLLPQYSHVMIISPNFGEIGAPQLGHFNDATPEGAITCAAVDAGGDEAAVELCEGAWFDTAAPHL